MIHRTLIACALAAAICLPVFAAPDIARYGDRPVKQGENKDTGTKAKFFVGFLQRMTAPDDFSTVNGSVPMGVLVNRTAFLFKPSLLIVNDRSVHQARERTVDGVYRPLGYSLMYDIGLSMNFRYFFIDPVINDYAPYLGAGPGYGFRGVEHYSKMFSFNHVKSLYTHSFTFNYGGGFMFKARQHLRISVDLAAVSYFNRKAASRFTYDTTGATLGMGAHLML